MKDSKEEYAAAIERACNAMPEDFTVADVLGQPMVDEIVKATTSTLIVMLGGSTLFEFVQKHHPKLLVEDPDKARLVAAFAMSLICGEIDERIPVPEEDDEVPAADVRR